MTYTIKVTGGNDILIPPGANDTSTSLTLIGKNQPNYGAYIAQDLVLLMQNFAGTNQPANAKIGQLWFDNNTGQNLLKVNYNGQSNGFKAITAVTNGTTSPNSNLQAGDLFFNTSTQQLSVYSGTAWVIVGPATAAGTTLNGPIANVIVDSQSTGHNVISMYVQGAQVGVFSKDSNFVVNTGDPAKTNFSSIATGLNLNAGLGAVFAGTAVKAQYADLAESYWPDPEEDIPDNAIIIFGGAKEVTTSTKSHDPRVAGIVSENPAFLMNDGTGGAPGLPVALTGRVPCQVIGPIEPGDCVVSSDVRGVGMKLDPKKYVPGCIVGKALYGIPDNSQQLIEVVVGIR
jgi:hypothetical protein